MSHDGRTIVGNGINPDGEQEGWVAVLPHQCDDGLDNDADSLADASDPECAFPTWNDEANACGIGFELALIVPLLQLLYRRSRMPRGQA